MTLPRKIDYVAQERYRRIRNHIVCGAGVAVAAVVQHCMANSSTKMGTKVIERERNTMDSIFKSIGPKNVRKAYRMHEESFRKLHQLLFKTDAVKRQRGEPPNGHILNSQRLGMALRWFAGGDKMDIAPHHGVAFQEVMKSVWHVVDAVNSSDELKMSFPDSHADQHKIAEGFQAKSSANFDNCVGCIDCMLVWTDKPSDSDKCGSDVGTTKYFCGRRKKAWC